MVDTAERVPVEGLPYSFIAGSNKSAYPMEVIGALGGRQVLRAPNLLVRCKALPGHNRQDFLMRIAAANGLRGIPELCRVLKTNYETLISLKPDQLNRYFSGTPLFTVVDSKTTRFHGRSLTKAGLSKQARICLQCLTSGSPLDRHFNLALPVPCKTHGTWPVDRCPACERSITYLRREIPFCDCGFSLAKLATSMPPSWLGIFHELFAPWHLGGAKAPCFSNLAANDAMAGGLIRILISRPVELPNQRCNGSPWISTNDLPAIEKLVSQWPNSFEESLEAHLNGAEKSREWQMLSRFRNEELPLLAQAAKRVGIRMGEARKVVARRKQPPGDFQAMVSIARVRNAAKLDAAATRSLMKSGCFKTVHVTEHNKFKRYWVSEDDLHSIQDLFDTTIDVEEAAARLGSAPSYVRALASCRWLRSEHLTCKPRSPRFKPETIENFISLLRNRAIASGHTPGKLYCIAHLPALYGNGDMRPPWLRLMKDVIADRIPLYALTTVTDLRDLHISERDMVRYRLKGSFCKK